MPLFATLLQLGSALTKSCMLSVQGTLHVALTHPLACCCACAACHHQGVLTWPAVEAAVAVGCHSLQEILAHISTNCQPLPVQQQAAAGGWPGRVNCQLLEPAKAAAGVVPVVSREHLQRELKLWVEEGRLVKAMRNCYKLPQQCA